MMRQPLFVRDHFLDGGFVGHVGISLGTKTAAALAVLLGEDMALECVCSLDLTGLGEGESLLSTAVGLKFGHGTYSFRKIRVYTGDSLLILFFCLRLLSLGSLGLCRLLRRGSGLGREEHGHVSAFKLGGLIQICNLSALLGKILEQYSTDIGVGHLSASEADGNLDSVAISQELLGVLQLGVEVIGVDTGRHADLLDLDNALVLLCFLFLFGLLETELTVVHDSADGRIGAGSYLDQIQILFNCYFEGFCCGHDAELLSFTADQAYFLVNDLLVDLMNSVCDC